MKKFTYKEKRAFLEEYKYPNVLAELVSLYPEKFENCADVLSGNPNITWEMMEPSWYKVDINGEKFIQYEKSKIDWVWEGMSRNPNITLDIVKNTLHKKWDWKKLSLNEAISLEEIKNNPDLPWVLSSIKKGRKHPRNTDVKYVILWKSKNILNFTDIDDYSGDRMLDKFGEEISDDFDIDMRVIKFDSTTDWKRLSYNPNLTLDIIQNNLDYWDWKAISINEFFYNDTVFNREYTKKLKEISKKILYTKTDVCPDMINEILSWIEV